MRNIVIVGGLLLLAGCGGNPSVPPVVSWSYGAGNGDGVQYPGPAPKYSFADGIGKDVPTDSGFKYTTQYGYGGDSTTGVMVGMAPVDKTQQLAAPAANTVPTPATTPRTHS